MGHTNVKYVTKCGCKFTKAELGKRTSDQRKGVCEKAVCPKHNRGVLHRTSRCKQCKTEREVSLHGPVSDLCPSCKQIKLNEKINKYKQVKKLIDIINNPCKMNGYLQCGCKVKDEHIVKLRSNYTRKRKYCKKHGKLIHAYNVKQAKIRYKRRKAQKCDLPDAFIKQMERINKAIGGK